MQLITIKTSYWFREAEFQTLSLYLPFKGNITEEIWEDLEGGHISLLRHGSATVCNAQAKQ